MLFCLYDLHGSNCYQDMYCGKNINIGLWSASKTKYKVAKGNTKVKYLKIDKSTVFVNTLDQCQYLTYTVFSK